MRYLCFLALLGFLACQSEPQPQHPAPEIGQIGKAVSDSLLKTLGTNLSMAIQDSGFPGALSFCNIQALPLTQHIKSVNNRVADIKRISEKWRNPQNQPDLQDQRALDYFESTLEKGEKMPPNYILPVGESEYRYYRPLTMAAVCLNCHGPANQLADGVLDQLQTFYPQDNALDYQEGDFRGIIRVSISP